MKISYVILHYNAIDVTCACVNSIASIKNADNCIVIVDNNSPNGSGDELEKLYSNNDDIYVIKSNSNLGFARGNNLGYRFAKDNLLSDIIVDMNNDIEILDHNFENHILETIANYERLGIISPRIKNIKGYDQNPYRIETMSTAIKIRTFFVYSLYFLGLYLPLVNKKLYKHFSIKYHRREIDHELATTKRMNIVPHGSFIIFCPSFVKRFRNAFVEDTFFYGEEDILFDMLKKYNLDSLYCPDIEILHKEKVATATISKDEIKRSRFAAKNKARSAFVCVHHRNFGYLKNLDEK